MDSREITHGKTIILSVTEIIIATTKQEKRRQQNQTIQNNLFLTTVLSVNNMKASIDVLTYIKITNKW